MLSLAGLPESGQAILKDGRTGDLFRQTHYGRLYVYHEIESYGRRQDARACNRPLNSMITQHPLGRQSAGSVGTTFWVRWKCGALEAYGASHVLQEMLTVKSDDVRGSVIKSIKA